MSAALVRRSLALLDDTCEKKPDRPSNVFDLIPENQKLKRKVKRSKGKDETVNVLRAHKKFTVTEAKKLHKSKEQIIKENLKKLKKIREVCKIELDKNITSQIIQRAVTRRPVKPKKAPKKKGGTVFTEEDFKKFEAEYFDED